MNITIIGGGWGGVAAAVAAKKVGTNVTLIEKTDLLLGVGNVGGIMRNNGRFTATEEMIAMGGGELFELIDHLALHRNVEFPGHRHAMLYPVHIMEPHVRRYLLSIGVALRMESRVTGVKFTEGRIQAVRLHTGETIDGDVFVEATGSAGPMGNCLRYGNGCSMCVLRCPAYGPRISISAECGVMDFYGERADDVPGAFSGSCKLAKESLAPKIRDELDHAGVVILPIPPEDMDPTKLNTKACKQYALKEFSENIILLDTGHAKLMTSYYPLEKLRKIQGLEDARYVDPYAGGKGNSIRYLSIAPRTNDMRVDGVNNLFCAGEKSGLFIGHTEAISTGTLAGFNAARMALQQSLLELPEALAVGDMIALANHYLKEQNNLKERFTFAGGHFFERMKERGLYSTNIADIRRRVNECGQLDVFNRKAK